MIPKSLTLSFLIVAILSFIDAAYLSAAHFFAFSVNCSVLGDCELVTNSNYSMIGPIPIALLGMAYYLALILLVIFYLDRKKIFVLNLAAKLTWVGLIVSSYFIYLQLIILQAVCFYCMLSAIGSLILFILGQIILRKTKRIIPNARQTNIS